MKPGCDCQYCKKGVDEYFCIICGVNFNSCESFFQLFELPGDLPILGIELCPTCHPENSEYQLLNVRKK